MARYEKSGTRIMDLAFLRDNSENVYTDEALVLACLLHAKGKKRNNKDTNEVARLLDDPNQSRSK